MSDLDEWNAAIRALRVVLGHMGTTVPVSRDDPTLNMAQVITGTRFVPHLHCVDDVKAIQTVIGILSGDLSRWYERDRYLRKKEGG